MGNENQIVRRRGEMHRHNVKLATFVGATAVFAGLVLGGMLPATAGEPTGLAGGAGDPRQTRPVAQQGGVVNHERTGTKSEADQGADVPSTLFERIEGIHTAQQATVILVPGRMRFYFGHNPEEVWEYGCKFVTRDHEHITALIELLNHADVRAETSIEPLLQSRAPGEKIVLRLADGAEITLWFYLPGLESSTAIGRLSNSRSAEMEPVIADASQLNELYVWAKTVGGLSARDASRKKICEDKLKGVDVK